MRIYFLLINVVTVLLLITGIIQQTKKSTLPESTLIALFSTDSTFTLNNKPITSRSEIEVLCDGVPIDSAVSISRTLNPNSVEYVKTISYYSGVEFILLIICVIVFYVLGILVYILRPTDPAAWMFFIVMIVFSVLIGTSSGGVYDLPLAVIVLLQFSFHCSYVLAPVVLLHFVTVFPFHQPLVFGRKLLYFLYATAVVIGVTMTYLYIAVTEHQNLWMSTYLTLFQIVRFMFGVLIVASVVLMLRCLRKSENSADRNKVLWMLYGITVGPVSFLLLTIIPVYFNKYVVFAESTFRLDDSLQLLLFIAAPIMFAIAIVRYKMFTIELIVNRSVVYVGVSGLLLLIYTTLVAILTSIAHVNEQQLLFFVIPLIIILNVLLFLPAKGVIQRFVDTKFFRVQYDFRKAYTGILSKLQNALGKEEVAEIVCKEVHALLKPEIVVFFEIDQQSVAIALSVQTQVAISNISEPFSSPPYEATYSLLSEQGTLYGYLCVGKKRSGQQYNDEDIDMLVNISNQSAGLLERFSLQENIVLQRAESQRLTELNELKSYFVSGVTHELKTPLTSIKMFSEMLLQQSTSEKSTKYLSIINGETERLTRLINNVLDYSKIERGVMEYHKTDCDVNKVVRSVTELMKYQIEMNGCSLVLMLSENNPHIYADPDGLTEVLINLISNAIKYSADEKYIAVLTTQHESSVEICVSDKGVGIPADKVTEIFKPFYRLKDMQTARVGGAGLGLPLVKHYVDAHNGTIAVHSKVGKGTEVIITFE
ncbi:MAG: ATP-binding protein [Candidatus Kapaibacterium sp.]